MVTAIPLCHGGTFFTAGNTPQGAPGLASESTRGVKVSSIQFDLSGFTTCWLLAGSNLPAGHIVKHYMAIIRADFDTFTYMGGGLVIPDWPRVPNIIESDLSTLPGALQAPVFNREEDIFWRGYEEAISRNCTQCFQPAAEACSPLGDIGGLVTLSLDSTSDNSMARSYNLRHVKLRTGRFLRPNQALFFVENWVTTIPAGAQFIWNTNIYGSLATRVAR